MPFGMWHFPKGRAQVLYPNSKSECWEKQFTDGTEDKPQGHSGTWQILGTWVILELAVLDVASGEFARNILGTVLADLEGTWADGLVIGGRIKGLGRGDIKPT